jgi:hypothetical protein
MYKLEYYVPAEELEEVNNAVFAAGAGRVGAYEHCCWITEGTGQFRPLAGANPFIGAPGQLETLPEYKVEMVVGDAQLEAAVRALIEAHPYETPAYQVIALVNR